MGSARVQASRPAPAMAAPGAAPDARRRPAAARRPRAHRVRLVGRRRGAARLLHRPLFRFFPGLGLPRSRRMVPAWPVCLTTPSCTACRISASCAALGYSALAITDECSLAGAVRAHQAAKEQKGLKLILGTEIRLHDGMKLVLLAADRRSYGVISSLITTGRRRG